MYIFVWKFTRCAMTRKMLLSTWAKKRSFLLSFLFKQQNEETFLLISYTSKYDIGPDHLLALRIGISNRLLSPRT